MAMYAKLKEAQPHALRIIENSIKNNRLSHAYLFAGPEGTYKKEMAYHFALSLYCKEDVPCYKCPACQAILENRHLNVTYISTLGQGVKKEQIMALQDEFSKTSLIEGARVYIIDEADTMSVSAANSLLKFIEEPVNEETYGILITKHKDNILPTIISRSMVVKFDELDKNIIKRELTTTVESKLMIDAVASVTGNIKDAIDMLKNDGFIKLVNVFEMFVDQVYKGNPLVLFYRANMDVLANRDKLRLFLTLLECFYRDIYEYKISKHVLVFNSLEEKIKELSIKIDSEEILKYLFNIIELNKRIKQNVSINLAVDQFLIDLNGGI
jgi:DNA polymerase-3 subunit delta'